MSDNYYDKLLADIRKNISEGNYEIAQSMLEEELDMPYVPSKVLEELRQLEKEIKPFLVKQKEIRMMSSEEIAASLKKGGEAVYDALRNLNYFNIRNNLEVIQDYLLDPGADRFVVSMLIEACQKQQVSTPLSYYHDGVRQVVIPNKLQGMFEDETVNRAYDCLVSMLESQNPSFLKQCEQVLVQYVYRNYPQKYEGEAENLAYSIIRYVYMAYDDEEGFEAFAREFKVNREKLFDIII